MSERIDRDAFLRLSHAERQAIINRLQDEVRAHLGLATPSPVEPEVIKTPTKRMRRAVERFDAMTDSEQVDELRTLWGEA